MNSRTFGLSGSWLLVMSVGLATAAAACGGDDDDAGPVATTGGGAGMNKGGNPGDGGNEGGIQQGGSAGTGEGGTGEGGTGQGGTGQGGTIEQGGSGGTGQGGTIEQGGSGGTGQGGTIEQGGSGGTGEGGTIQQGGSAGTEQGGSGGEPVDCTAATDCGSCGSLDGCGFCGSTGECLAGGNDGPAQGECEAGWTGSPDMFSCDAALCAAITACDECGAQGCGWCADVGKCSGGSSEGPSLGYPACTEGFWYWGMCPDDCGGEMTCVSCSFGNGNGKNCGWCKETLQCMPGTSDGPTMGYSCASGWDTSGDPFTCSD